MKFDIFLKGKKVDLVCLNEDLIDKTDWYKWVNDQDLSKFLNQGFFPNTKESQKKYYQENILSQKRLQLGIVHKKSNTLIGTNALFNIDYINRCCSISSLMNMKDKKINSINYFIEAQELLINHAFYKLNLRRILGGTHTKALLEVNIRVLSFKHEGTFREGEFRQGRYMDFFVFGLLKKDWEKRNATK